MVPSLVPSVAGFSFIRFSGFLWVIDGPTNAVAIDPLIVVMVPGYSESELFLGMILDLDTKFPVFLVTSAFLLRLRHGSNIDSVSLKSFFTARVCRHFLCH